MIVLTSENSLRKSLTLEQKGALVDKKKTSCFDQNKKKSFIVVKDCITFTFENRTYTTNWSKVGMLYQQGGH